MRERLEARMHELEAELAKAKQAHDQHVRAVSQIKTSMIALAGAMAEVKRLLETDDGQDSAATDKGAGL